MLDVSLQKKQGRLVLLASLPQSFVLLWLMYLQEVSGYLMGITFFILLMLLTYCLIKMIQLQNYRIATITNLVESMVNNEFNIRGKTGLHNNAIEEMLNRLSKTLGLQQREIKQKQYLISKIINNIDIAIIALDEHQRLSFINAGAERLFDEPATSLVSKSAQTLGITFLIDCPAGEIIEWRFPNKHGRFQINKDSYFEDGQKKSLFFITNVSAILREEQHQAWGNLFRVMSHEINNTLAPIASLSQVLRQLLPKEKDEALTEVNKGLVIIEERSKSLKSFIDSYRTLNQLPAPSKSSTQFSTLIEGIQPLFEHRSIDIRGDRALYLYLDPVQIQQILINILKNSDESMTDSDGKIFVEWRNEHNQFHLDISDQGTGLTNTDNLFVPFYTTKASGSGIGLTLCRNIAENHGGYFTLENRKNQSGCIAKLVLPLMVLS